MPAYVSLIVVIAALAPMAYLIHRYIPPAPPDRDVAQPRSIFHAHEVMQDHGDCHIEACTAKWSAYWMLADGGHLKPTAHMERMRMRAAARS